MQTFTRSKARRTGWTGSDCSSKRGEPLRTSSGTGNDGREQACKVALTCAHALLRSIHFNCCIEHSKRILPACTAHGLWYLPPPMGWVAVASARQAAIHFDPPLHTTLAAKKHFTRTCTIMSRDNHLHLHGHGTRTRSKCVGKALDLSPAIALCLKHHPHKKRASKPFWTLSEA